MSTTTGGFLDSFNKWKALPERKDTEAFKKGSTFEKNLRILFKNTTKLSFDPLKDIYYDALAKKK